MTRQTMNDTDTSCQVDLPSNEMKSRMSSNTVTNTRNIQACGSTRQSTCTSQMYIQTSIPYIRAVKMLTYLTGTVPPTKNGMIPRNWSAWIAARIAATPARIARIVTQKGRSLMCCFLSICMIAKTIFEQVLQLFCSSLQTLSKAMTRNCTAVLSL